VRVYSEAAQWRGGRSTELWNERTRIRIRTWRVNRGQIRPFCVAL